MQMTHITEDSIMANRQLQAPQPMEMSMYEVRSIVDIIHENPTAKIHTQFAASFDHIAKCIEYIYWCASNVSIQYYYVCMQTELKARRQNFSSNNFHTSVIWFPKWLLLIFITLGAYTNNSFVQLETPTTNRKKWRIPKKKLNVWSWMVGNTQHTSADIRRDHKKIWKMLNFSIEINYY